MKDKKLRKMARGDDPKILLEMFFVYNKVREDQSSQGCQAALER